MVERLLLKKSLLHQGLLLLFQPLMLHFLANFLEKVALGLGISSAKTKALEKKREESAKEKKKEREREGPLKKKKHGIQRMVFIGGFTKCMNSGPRIFE